MFIVFVLIVFVLYLGKYSFVWLTLMLYLWRVLNTRSAINDVKLIKLRRTGQFNRTSLSLIISWNFTKLCDVYASPDLKAVKSIPNTGFGQMNKNKKHSIYLFHFTLSITISIHPCEVFVYRYINNSVFCVCRASIICFAVSTFDWIIYGNVYISVRLRSQFRWNQKTKYQFDCERRLWFIINTERRTLTAWNTKFILQLRYRSMGSRKPISSTWIGCVQIYNSFWSNIIICIYTNIPRTDLYALILKQNVLVT